MFKFLKRKFWDVRVELPKTGIPVPSDDRKVPLIRSIAQWFKSKFRKKDK